MIKRAIALLLLLGAGFLLLQLAVGEAAFGSPEAARKAAAGKGTASAPSSGQASPGSAPRGAIPISGRGSEDKPVKAALSGALDVRQRREIPIANGQVMLLTVYRVLAEDCIPLSDERYRLERVTILFHELGEKTATPKEQLAGELHASAMLVTLGRDDHGAPSLREDKEMELFDAVLTTNEHARAKDVELQIAHAFVLAADDGTRIRSATDDEPFVMKRHGENAITLAGRGATAFLPASRGQKNSGASRRMELRAASDPDLKSTGARGESRLTARGAMLYEEDLDRGAAHIVVAKDVVLDDPASRSTARGDHLEGWFARGTTPGQKAGAKPGTPASATSWRRLVMLGAPCRVVTEDVELTCERLVVTPGPFGDPALLTATGNSPRIVQKDKNGTPTTVVARDGIRLLRVAGSIGAGAKALGFPRTGLGGRFDQVVWFDGPTTLQQDTLTANADVGITLLRGVAGDPRTGLVGKGKVAIRRGDLAVDGDEGFTIATDGADTRLVMASQEQKLTAHLPQNALHDLATLDVAVRGNELRSFTATGKHCRIEAEAADGRVTGSAQRIVATDPRSVGLFGAPAHIERGNGDTIDAPEIRIGRGSGKATLVEAFHGATVRVSSLARGDATGPKQPIDLRAETVRLVPFLAPREVRNLLYGRLSVGARRVAETSLGSGWVFADGAVRLDQAAAEGGAKNTEAHATGDRLALDIGSGTGQLVGAPAKVTAHDQHGQENRGEAPSLRIAQGRDGQIVRLLPFGRSLPRLVVGGQGGPGNQRGKTTQLEVICNGEITIAPDKITFGGSGRVRSLLPSGEPDPNGLALTAQHLEIDRDEKSGEAKKLLAKGDVVIVSAQVLARAEEATLATEHAPEPGRIELWDPRPGDHDVSITFASGLHLEAPRIHFNWITGACETWRGGIQGGVR